ncbi:MAG: class I SAM-dependent methyltransferase [Spirochaetales bacterium]
MFRTRPDKRSEEVLLQAKEVVPAEFDHIATRYDGITSLSQGYFSDLQLSVSRMRLKGGEYVLDLCCGTGKSTKACLEALPRGRVLGVDNSEQMLAVAKEKFCREIAAGQVAFLKQDAMNLQFPDNTFDGIFMAYGLRNMPDYIQCLKGVFRVLKPGGILGVHEYSLVDKPYARVYWKLLGYGLILPLSTVFTGNSLIFKYLIKSVLQFPSPLAVVKLLEKVGFIQIETLPLTSWRAPILHTFIAKKPG